MLAVAEVGTNSVGFAATDPAEAMPGPNWGLGQHKPLVCGAAGTMLAFQTIAADQLVTLSTGNAQLIWLNHDLDGPAAGFGARFWKALSAVDPLTVAALKCHGVTKAVYCDRYLLTPLNLRLLYEVILALPGKASGLTVEVETALCDRPGQVGWAPFHPFGDDGLRRAVLQQLFPRAKIIISPKTQRPHARSLSLHLSDGRRLQILLDQGFGAWRLEGASTRYDFSCTPEKQARDIKNTPMRLHIAETRGAPAILEFQ